MKYIYNRILPFHTHIFLFMSWLAVQVVFEVYIIELSMSKSNGTQVIIYLFKEVSSIIKQKVKLTVLCALWTLKLAGEH